MSRLSGAERGGRRANPKPEAVLKFAEHPIRLLAGAWEEARQDWAQSDEDRPPVFILVCKNTRLAGVIYEWLAQGKPPEGIPPANIPELRNQNGNVSTIRVDSKVIDETDVEGAKNDESRWMRFTLDTVGKREWPQDLQGQPVYPEEFKELAGKLERPLHPPGRDVRCIISVGMLTEGWDCNTVTHIVGLRPFMSQLLCEQVVGRGLRRASYDLTEEGKFSEEVAQILGVPFEVVPFKQRKGSKPPAARQNHVHALGSRAKLEIRFPRVEGYQQRIRNRVDVAWPSIAEVRVDPMKIPNVVKLKSTLLNQGRPSLLEPGGMAKLDLEKWRGEATRQQREFQMAAALTRHYSEQDKCDAPPQVLFAQMLEVVKRFVRDRVVVDDETKRIDVFLSPYWGYAIERLTEAIHPAASNGEDAEIPRYEQRRGVGSTADVDFWTAKKVREIERSHLNYVVQDSKWESSAAYHLDNSPHVVSFVKNQGLGFAIPYLHAGGDHEYFPDFIVKFTNGVMMILETKGYDEREGVKRQAAERWVRAVNADGNHGEWHYELTHNPNEVPYIIDRVASNRGAVLASNGGGQF
jgi:type III restriction enzyme